MALGTRDIFGLHCRSMLSIKNRFSVLLTLGQDVLTSNQVVLVLKISMSPKLLSEKGDFLYLINLEKLVRYEIR